MDAQYLSLPTLTELRRHILRTLCAHDQLDPSQTPMYESAITLAGNPCGLFFQARGPRQVKSYAVWTAKERRILFYDAAGERFAETKLRKSPGLQEIAA